MDSIDKLKTRKVLAAILSQVSALMLGIGLFAYFGDGDVLHPLLTNMVVVWALILVGGFFCSNTKLKTLHSESERSDRNGYYNNSDEHYQCRAAMYPRSGQ